MWALSLAMICGLSFSRRYSLSFGVMLDEEPLAVGMELPVELDDLAADGEHPAGKVQIAGCRFREFRTALGCYIF
jgi:hypothetical protein